MTLRIINTDTDDITQYIKHYADALIITHDNQILLQKRVANQSHAGQLCLFGGYVEAGESPKQALIRELYEELGAGVKGEEISFIGAVSEDFANHTELIHIYIWHDKNATITGCYEGETIIFDTADHALKQPNLMEYAAWALKQDIAKE